MRGKKNLSSSLIFFILADDFPSMQSQRMKKKTAWRLSIRIIIALDENDEVAVTITHLSCIYQVEAERGEA